MRTMVALALAILLSSATAVGAAPSCFTTNTYSMPFGEPPLALCCTTAQQGELAPVFTSKSPYAQRDPAIAVAKSIHESTTGTSSSCVKFDSLTPLEKLRARGAILTAGGSCKIVAGSYEHFLCECRTSCSVPVAWSCNCPGVASGETPQAAPENFPQDSYKSRPELISSFVAACNTENTCEQIPANANK